MNRVVIITGSTRGIGFSAESGIKVFAVLPGAVDTRLISDVGLEMDPSELMTPDYLARRVFEVGEGKERTGKSVEVYA
jgi:NAD(P)-dependent dehydrogenase (short-subunit alcohol dehydrogenase family)